MGLRWSSDSLQMEGRWVSSEAWMTASGHQRAAELAQIAFGPRGHNGLLMSLRKASDELHIRRRQLSYEASMTVSELQLAEEASQNTFLGCQDRAHHQRCKCWSIQSVFLVNSSSRVIARFISRISFI